MPSSRLLPSLLLFPYTTLFRSGLGGSPSWNGTRRWAATPEASRSADAWWTTAATGSTPHATPPCSPTSGACSARICSTVLGGAGSDRKSTRLNSSHLVTSYAVFSPSSELAPLSLHDALPIWAGRVTVLERNETVGGNAGSFEVGGCLVDYGSHRLHPACDPTVLADIRGLLGEDLLDRPRRGRIRSEEHTSELQSPCNLVCRLLAFFRACSSFPTRRSSDLGWAGHRLGTERDGGRQRRKLRGRRMPGGLRQPPAPPRMRPHRARRHPGPARRGSARPSSAGPDQIGRAHV